jgi:hypothetical protein
MEAKLESEAPEYCLRHPNVETALRCGNCGDLICPRCLVYTPVGARCPTCARVRPAPMYEVAPQHLALSYLTAIVAGAGAGVVWWVLTPLTFGLFLAIAGGAALGWGMYWVLDRVSRGKRGRFLQAAAALGIVTAYVVRNIVGADALFISGDGTGIIVLVVAVLVAGSQLR